jgi:hypothetical protein
VYHYCLRRVHRPEDAEDLAGLVFIRALAGLREYRGGSFAAWLFRIAHNAAANGLAARCQLSGGDFFQGVPRGGDGYILMAILHDWGDDEAGVILGQIRHAIDEAGRLLIIEQVIPPGTLPHPGKMRDMSMLLVGGKERTEAEFRSLLASAGFAVERVVPVGSVFDMSIIEARPT